MTQENTTEIDLDEDDMTEIAMISDMSHEQVLSILHETLNQACSAMDDKGGFRAGFLLRQAQKIVSLTGVTPQVIDDYDLDRGGVYPCLDGREKPLEYTPPDPSILKDAQTQEEAFAKYAASVVTARDELNAFCEFCSKKMQKLIEAGKVDDAVEFAHAIPHGVARAFAFDALRQSGLYNQADK